MFRDIKSNVETVKSEFGAYICTIDGRKECSEKAGNEMKNDVVLREQ